MLKGLQTNFNSRIDTETLNKLKEFRFDIIRIDAQTSSDELMLEMIQDAADAGLQPFIIINKVSQLYALPSGIWVEWTNELDGDVSPSSFYPPFAEACAEAKSRGILLWAPTISNLDEDSLKWMNDVRDQGNGWPDGLYGCSAHRYGDGTFEHPHDGFSSREAEVRWLKAACQGKPYLISEVGYPTMDNISDEKQAENLTLETNFWTENDCQAMFIFQLNDGPSEDREARYGIRRFDGTWKPSAFIFTDQNTTPDRGDFMSDETLFTARKSDLIQLNDGKYALRYPHGESTVLSVQPDGRRETRPDTSIGAWETADYFDGNRLVYDSDGNLWTVWVEANK